MTYSEFAFYLSSAILDQDNLQYADTFQHERLSLTCTLSYDTASEAMGKSWSCCFLNILVNKLKLDKHHRSFHEFFTHILTYLPGSIFQSHFTAYLQCFKWAAQSVLHALNHLLSDQMIGSNLSLTLSVLCKSVSCSNRKSRFLTDLNQASVYRLEMQWMNVPP